MKMIVEDQRLSCDLKRVNITQPLFGRFGESAINQCTCPRTYWPGSTRQGTAKTTCHPLHGLECRELQFWLVKAHFANGAEAMVEECPYEET